MIIVGLAVAVVDVHPHGMIMGEIGLLQTNGVMRQFVLVVGQS